jgi:hypothetical protein
MLVSISLAMNQMGAREARMLASAGGCNRSLGHVSIHRFQNNCSRDFHYGQYEVEFNSIRAMLYQIQLRLAEDPLVNA